MPSPSQDRGRSAGADSLPPLYGRIFYDLKLESEALERLHQLDLAGCRRTFSSGGSAEAGSVIAASSASESIVGLLGRGLT